jgi:hypothetical protein
MLDQAAELVIARAVAAHLTERGPLTPDDCVMLIGSSVSGFGHARSDLDLLVCGPTPGRLPLHMFYEGRRVDVDFLYPDAWHETRGRVNACARSVTEPFDGLVPPAVDDRDWWADHLWLYDRVVHGVPITENTAGELLRDATTERLSAAIENYCRALCLGMLGRSRLHRAAGNRAAAGQYACEALLAAVEAVAAARGVTFWSDRTVLEKGRRVHRPTDPWDPDGIEQLFSGLVRMAWNAGPDRTPELSGVVEALLGPLPADNAVPGVLRLELVGGWKAQVAGGAGYLLGPDRSLYRASSAAARFVAEAGAAATVSHAVAAELAAAGAAVIAPAAPIEAETDASLPWPNLPAACPVATAPSPESWLSSHVAAHWYAMTVWSLSDDLHGVIASGQPNRVMPILRKAEVFLRMMTIARMSGRREVNRNTAMDLQGCPLDAGFAELADLVDAGELDRVPPRAVEVFTAVMALSDMPAGADMFERSRAFMKQVADVRVWFRVSEGLGIPIEAPGTLLAKGAATPGGAHSAVVADAVSPARQPANSLAVEGASIGHRA